MKPDIITLVTLADDVARFAREVKEATDPNGPRGRKVTVAELGEIVASGGALVAHATLMIAGLKARQA